MSLAQNALELQRNAPAAMTIVRVENDVKSMSLEAIEGTVVANAETIAANAETIAVIEEMDAERNAITAKRTRAGSTRMRVAKVAVEV